jgi:hypothetical protein
MMLVYYGNDVYLCDALEVVRQANPGLYDTSDCCSEPDSCCSTGTLSSGGGTIANSVQTILNNWSLSSTYSSSTISESQVITELINNRPFIVRQINTITNNGHAKIIYGYSTGNLYAHNPGQGSEILDYDEYIFAGSDNVKWVQTLRMNSSATTCPLTQHIIGIFKVSIGVNTYKAQQDIFMSCNVQSSADTEFLAGDDIVFEDGFQVDLGGSALFKSGETVICP